MFLFETLNVPETVIADLSGCIYTCTKTEEATEGKTETRFISRERNGKLDDCATRVLNYMKRVSLDEDDQAYVALLRAC